MTTRFRSVGLKAGRPTKNRKTPNPEGVERIIAPGVNPGFEVPKDSRNPGGVQLAHPCLGYVLIVGHEEENNHTSAFCLLFTSAIIAPLAMIQKIPAQLNQSGKPSPSISPMKTE